MSLRREEAKVLAASSYALRRLNRDDEAGSRIDRALALLEQTNTKFERPNAVDFDPVNAAIVVRSALGDHHAAMGQTTLAANVFATLLADVTAGKIEPRRLLSHATTLSNLYIALSTLHARNGDAERAAAAAAHRQELWEHWAKQLPNSGFVRKQLAAARVD
jgi:hypothetical protein